VLNLGNNEFEELPLPLVRCCRLKKLYMFNNKLSALSEQIGEKRLYVNLVDA
jgi:Leucine-rich repeat (LRR) protein